MMRSIAELHARALPHTSSSKRGVIYLEKLYKIVETIGYLYVIKRSGKIVGAISGVGPLILTLVVDPEWQRKGIGRELVDAHGSRRYVYTEECTVGFYEKLGFRKIIQVGETIFLWRK